MPRTAAPEMIGLDDRRQHAGGRDRLAQPALKELTRRYLSPVAHPPLLKMDEFARRVFICRLGEAHVSFYRLIAHRQQANPRLPAPTEKCGRLAQALAARQQVAAHDMGCQIEVAEGKPVETAPIGGDFHRGTAGLIRSSPALLLGNSSPEGVHDRVEVGADSQPVEGEIVADVGDHGDFHGRCFGTRMPPRKFGHEPPGEAGAPTPPAKTVIRRSMATFRGDRRSKPLGTWKLS